MIAAVGSVLITPWNLYNNPETIHYTLDTLGAFIGPLFGVLIAALLPGAQAEGGHRRPVHAWTRRECTTTRRVTTRRP